MPPICSTPRGLRRAAAVAWSMLGAAACGGGGGDGGVTGAAVSGAVASVSLTPAAVTVEVGGSATLQARALDGAGRAVPGQPIVWTSADTTIARVAPDGRVIGMAIGAVEIAANVAGRFAKATVTVGPRAVAAVELAPASQQLVVGARQQLVARALHADGSELVGRPIAWATSDARVATVDSVGLVAAVAPGAATITATSEGRTATAAVTVVAVPVASLSLAPATDTIVVGQSTQLTATALDSAGTALGERPIAWTSSDAAVASVSASGLVLGVAPGAADVSATVDGQTRAARVVVLARPVGAVIVSPATSTLAVGDSVTLAAQVTDASGALLAGRPVAFSTSNAAVARVSDAGVVTAAGVGVATITATSEGRTGSATVTVGAAVAASIDVQPASATLTVGQRLTLTAVARDRAGNALAGRAVTWTSGAPGIATVDADGRLTATSPGTAVILATADRAVATVTVTVRAPVVAVVHLVPPSLVMLVGDVRDLAAVAVDSAGAPVPEATIAFVSSDPSIATVSASGRVRAVSVGATQIAAISGGVTAVAAVSVIPEPVVTVSIGGVPASLAPGATATLTATARDRFGAVVVGRPVAWSTGNTAVVTISPSGVLTAVAAGTTDIAAVVDGITATATVTVTAPAPAPAPTPTPPTVASVAVALGTSSLQVGQGTQATATARDGAGAAITGRTVAWTSTAPGVATVSSAGVVAAVGAGTANITATIDGVAGSATLTVTAAPTTPTPPTVASVSVTLAASSLTVGQATTATATVRDAAGNAIAGQTIAWSTSDASVATVAPSGAVTAVGAGTASIVATGGGRTGSAALTVTVTAPPPPPPSVASVDVTLGASSLAPGATTTATATVRDGSGVTLANQPVTWTTSNAAVATVSASGVVTAVAPGTASITATSGGRSGSAALAVVAPPPAPVATVSVSLGAAALVSGQGTTATATLRDAAGNVLPGRAIAWTSSNPLVASVSSSGAVLALLPGTATITATSEGRSGSATLTVAAPLVVRVDVAPGNLNLDDSKANKRTGEFRAVAYDLTGREVPGATFAWSVADPSIASIAPGANGAVVVTALRKGTTTVTARSGGASDSARVQVR